MELDNHSEGYSSVVEEVLSRINVALLNTIQNLVMNITLDIFMDWVEIGLFTGTPENYTKIVLKNPNWWILQETNEDSRVFGWRFPLGFVGAPGFSEVADGRIERGVE